MSWRILEKFEVLMILKMKPVGIKKDPKDFD